MRLCLFTGAALLEALLPPNAILPIVLSLQLLSYPGGTRGLRMTALQIPQHVVLNQTVKMECNFNLDRELLYSVKWYKDGHEFYRFVPKESPAVQVFPVAGVSVDMNHSTERSIALNSVELDSSGRYRCEVSAEAPAFQTVSDHADMSVVEIKSHSAGNKASLAGGATNFTTDNTTQYGSAIQHYQQQYRNNYRKENLLVGSSVGRNYQEQCLHFLGKHYQEVVLPEKGPRITGGRAKYLEGELVRMNCTSAPSKPAALLTWFINGEPADSQYLRGPHITAVDERGLETAVLGVEFHVSGKHFKKGDMKLKCLATIATIYLQGKEESVEGDDRVVKAPVMESRETRAQSHTRNDLTNDSERRILAWTTLVVSIVATLIQR